MSKRVSEGTSKSAGSSRRRYILLLVAIGLVIAGWSGAWVFGRSVLAGQLDQQMASLGRQGLDLSCSDLSIGGFPFRYEVSCRDLASRDRAGAEGAVGALNAVALIYNPWHLIFEAKPPASVSEPLSGLLGEMHWETARASIKLADGGLGALDAVVQQPEAAVENTLSSGLFGADKAELHIRHMPDSKDDAEGFLSVNALRLKSVPEFGKPIDLRAHIQVTGGALLLDGLKLPALVQIGNGRLPVKLVLLETVIGPSRVAAHGELVINGDGTLSGQMSLTIGHPEAFMAALKPLFPSGDKNYELVRTVVQNMAPLTKELDGEPSIVLPFSLERGLVRAGLMPLTRIPPLFSAGS